jgi:DNA-binding response OmpR family regulator
MQKPQVLIISDEPETARVWGYSLNQIGLDVIVIGLLEQPLQAFSKNPPDLIIIEDFNADVEELELCVQLRKIAVIPILFLTSKTTETFFLETYKIGVDECIPLPVSPRLFQAKVKAWLRRTQSIPATALDEIKAGGFRLDPTLKRVTTAQGQTIPLTSLEMRLLLVLMHHPALTIDSQQLVERVWGYFGNGDRLLLKNLVYRLRRKIEPDPTRPRYLLRCGNTGYQFTPDGETSG